MMGNGVSQSRPVIHRDVGAVQRILTLLTGIVPHHVHFRLLVHVPLPAALNVVVQLEEH